MKRKIYAIATILVIVLVAAFAVLAIANYEVLAVVSLVIGLILREAKELIREK